MLVIDEAGSVPSRQMEQALRLAEERGAHLRSVREIRDNHEDLRLAGRGRGLATLTRRDTTQAERLFAKNYLQRFASFSSR